jgi:hypothetical protein
MKLLVTNLSGSQPPPVTGSERLNVFTAASVAIVAACHTWQR